MTKHAKYPITTRIYRPHLSKYVFVIFVQVAEIKIQITNLYGSESILNIHHTTKKNCPSVNYNFFCNFSVYIQYRQISKD